MLEHKNVLLGVSASIAIYKACEIISVLKEKKANIRVVMTKEAAQWISPVVFEALTNNTVYVDPISELKEKDIGTNITHITLSDWADAFLLAPATANIIAKIAHGIADDSVSLIALATKANKVIAPAMNSHMYENPITQSNIKILKENGWFFADSTIGELACKKKGIGHIAGCKDIVDIVDSTFYEKILKGTTIIVSAGPTREAIDPVRYVSNNSSGKMGFALAKIAAKMGSDVKLVTGPSCLKTPILTERMDVISVNSMLKVIDKFISESKSETFVIMAAAVGDFKPSIVYNKKIKRDGNDVLSALKLDNNVDIIKTLKNKYPNIHFIGFAAETDNLKENAIKKLESKKLDFIVVNDVLRKDIGFDSDYNEVTIIFKNGNMEHINKSHKDFVAFEILRRIKS